MRLEKEQRVPLDEARRRALAYLGFHRFQLSRASDVGLAIWPHNNLRAQGLGAAASRILKRLINEKLVAWTSRRGDWGYELTAVGSAAVQGQTVTRRAGPSNPREVA